ncbi:hypothetical protein TNCV_4414121 [Trichonephila clavipes]|uniref:Uncharacterized protein n=1 Tax=Trichonephila clavipes TaxID=2585209 RepID=A0A8X6V9G9_TRICX|nr:hypothetical protein TNCV_4414121 [Trichonephila clavipes]
MSSWVSTSEKAISRGCLVVKVTDLSVAEPSTSEDPPCRGDQFIFMLSLKRLTAIVEVRRGSASSGVILVT